MNSLIIIAHPNKAWFSHIIAHDYMMQKKKLWHDVRMIDLYDSEWRQDYLQMNETNRYLDDPLRSKHQEQISRADEVCFFFPLWWFDCPAILKNWFDVNYTQWFAFKYRSGNPIPEKLLKGKSARIFVTAWGPAWLYKTIGYLIITLPRYLGKIDYVGMKLRSWTWFADMNAYKTSESRERMREKVRKIARR